MNWGVFEYAGGNALALLIWLAALAGGMLLLAGVAWLALRRRAAGIALAAALAAGWLVAWWIAGPRLDDRWRYFKENANRSFGDYLRLTAATAVVPASGERGRDAFAHLSARDSGFGKTGRLVETGEMAGMKLETWEDEDYPGGVKTLEGRAVDTGYRFAAVRRYPQLVAVFSFPGAKTARLAGKEAELHAGTFRKLKIKVLGEDDETPADITYFAPLADWHLGADTPDEGDWRELAEGMAKGGVAALHLNTRLMPRARLKTILEDFRAAFGGYRLWCAGQEDFVATSGGTVLADEALELFADAEKYEAFAEVEIYSPAEMFAGYLGTDGEVGPALAGLEGMTHWGASMAAPRLACSPPPGGGLAAMRASELTPLEAPAAEWFAKGLTDADIFAALTNGARRVQDARREALLGCDAANLGAATNAVEHWAAAAKANPRDPLLAAVADSLDLEGRRYLRIGNAGGAIRCYENRLTIRPTDVAAIHNFGVCLKKAGHSAMAARVFARAVELDPLTDEHRLEMVECCANSDHLDIASRQLEVLMKRRPDDADLKMRAAKLLGMRKNKIRDVGRAIALAEEAVKMTDWKKREFVAGLADVYIECGRHVLGVGLKRRMKEMRFEE